MHRNLMQGFLTSFQLRTRQALSTWQTGNHYEMLAEMRKIALLILVDCLFGADFTPYLQSLWHSILRTLAYISPGLWLIFPDLPRFGYQAAIAKVDGYLFSLIQHRRTHPIAGDDLLSLLIAAGLDDRLIRDQLLTMLIAGHDTSTALLAWALYCLGKSPDHLEKVAAEVRAVPLENPFSLDDLKSFTTLEWVLQETLRLYPPIHAGNRLTNRAISFNGFTIPAHQRVIYSIYLTQRHPDFWQSPNQFMPERFLQRPAAWTYLPFGGGERICIGYLFAQIEAKAVLATLLREWQVQLLPQRVSLHMGATLEPRPGVRMKVTQIAR
ncbi:MAG TPA: cytochrome P450 [Anaerolineales bacterium]|nr:cytochrome P450 [Anaerolineales bacterium]